MPPIQQLSVNSTRLMVVGQTVLTTKTLTFAGVSPSLNTPAKAEDYINTTWIPANISGYQMVVHVFTWYPGTPNVACLCADLGVTIDPNWWNKGA